MLTFAFTKMVICQNGQIEVTIHARVDTSSTEIKQVATLWTNYLNSKPDSIYNNPFWNSEEKLKFKDFDLSRRFMYPFPSNELLNYYKPTILSIEKEGESYAIKTIFFCDNLEGDYRKSNPWCITKLYAIKEKGEWKLKNALSVLTENWKRKTIGNITFIYPDSHVFNDELALKSSDFCSNIAHEFDFPDSKPFEFYITKSPDELGKQLNFDFFFTGYSTGICYTDNRLLFSAFDSEFYPHEFIHLTVPAFNRHSLIEEGFATWKGGQGGQTFEESAKILASSLSHNDTVTFSDVLNRKWGWEYAAYYTTGAILCKAAFDKGGIQLVNQLLLIPDDDDLLVISLCEIFKIKVEDFEAFWKKLVIKYN